MNVKKFIPEKIKTKYVALTVGLLIALLITTVALVASNPDVISPNIYLDDIPSTVTYTIKSGSGYYWAVRYDGKKLWESTNASYVFNSIPADSSVFIRNARYVLDSHWAINSNVTVASDGAILEREAGSGTRYAINAEGKSNIKLSGFTIKYGDKTQGSAYLLRIKNSNNIRVTDVKIQDASYASVALTGNVFNVWFTRCEMTGIQDASGRENIAVFADGGSAPCDVWVESCNFDTRGLWVDSGAYDKAERWHVNNNDFINITGDVIGLYSVEQSEIIGNTIVWNKTTNIMNGIDIRNATGTTVIGNTLKRFVTDTTPANPNVGIYAGHGAQNSLISGNTIFNCTTGISLYGASNWTVSTNTIWGCSSNGISMDDDGTYNADQNLISGNNIRDCANGIKEVSTANWNMIIDCYVLGCTTVNILTVGANTECHSCFNGTTWVT